MKTITMDYGAHSHQDGAEDAIKKGQPAGPERPGQAPVQSGMSMFVDIPPCRFNGWRYHICPDPRTTMLLSLCKISWEWRVQGRVVILLLWMSGDTKSGPAFSSIQYTMQAHLGNLFVLLVMNACRFTGFELYLPADLYSAPGYCSTISGPEYHETVCQ